MDHDRNPINASERWRKLPLVAESAGLWLEEHLLWPAGDVFRTLREALRHGAESVAWFVRRGLIWPLQDRGEKLGAPGRMVAASAAVLAIAVGVAALVGTSSDSSGERPPSPVAVAAAEPSATGAQEKKATVEKAEPTLEGSAPVFKPTDEEKKTASQEPEPTSPAPAAPVDSDPATATIGTQPGGSANSAAASSTAQSPIGVDGPPAGPEAIAVAKEFAGAFVLYETGGENSQVRKTFAATATAELAKSLLRRPPRLPANVEVPKAKVVNVVAGPSHGGVYTISVSLLRVGLTSELRLDMEKQKKDWRVTNVLG